MTLVENLLIILASSFATLIIAILGMMASRRNADRARIDEMERRLDLMEGRLRRRDDYVNVLRGHIASGNPPPPPPYPIDYNE